MAVSTCPLCESPVSPEQVEGGMIRALLWLQSRTRQTFINISMDTGTEQQDQQQQWSEQETA